MKDSAIIDLFFKRSDTAVSELELKYGAEMKGYAKRYLVDRRYAEEVYNDTLVSLWNSIPPEHPNKLLAYTMTVLKRKILDRLKYLARAKRSRTEEMFFAEFEDLNIIANSESAEDAIINSRSGIVDEFLESETALSRRLFLKRYYYGKTVSEIADEMDMTETAVASRISRTKSRLYRHLERKGLLI